MIASTGLTDLEWNLLLVALAVLCAGALAVVVRTELRDRDEDSAADALMRCYAARTRRRMAAAAHPSSPHLTRILDARVVARAWRARVRPLRLAQDRVIGGKRFIPAGTPWARSDDWAQVPRRGVQWPIPAAGPQATVSTGRRIAEAAIFIDVAWERDNTALLPAEIAEALNA